MEFKVIFWIIVAVIWLVGNLWKKIKEAGANQASGVPTPPLPVIKKEQVSPVKSKPIHTKVTKLPSAHPTFKETQKKVADSLKTKNFVKQKAEVRQNESFVVKKYQVENYDSNLLDEERVAQKKIDADKEAAKKMKIREDVDQTAPMYFEPYEAHPSSSSAILRMLKNPEDVKNSIILAEILKKKF